MSLAQLTLMHEAHERVEARRAILAAQLAAYGAAAPYGDKNWIKLVEKLKEVM